jgi:alpha-beta hydrolase superfamily lysophospholipase
MWTEVSHLNLIELAPAMLMPVFFFLGRNDHWVPVETSLAYIEALAAPSKELVWFEESGHEPFVDEPAKFNAAMAEGSAPALLQCEQRRLTRTTNAAQLRWSPPSSLEGLASS